MDVLNGVPDKTTESSLVREWAGAALDQYKREARILFLASECEPDSDDLGSDESMIETIVQWLTGTDEEREAICTETPLRALGVVRLLRSASDATKASDELTSDLSLVEPGLLDQCKQILLSMVSSQDEKKLAATKLLFYVGLDDMGILSQLHEVDLRFEFLTERELAMLQFASNLESLNLTGTALGINGLSVVAGLTSLREILVAHTGIASLSALADLESLRKINLSATQIQDADVAQLCRLPKLAEVDLRFTDVTDFGELMLRQAIPGIQILR